MLEILNRVSGGVFWFLVVVGILVFLHEAGHFLTAKFFGMRVEAFSLGFGKRLFGWRRGGTDYRVNLIPLGGYVKMLGEYEETEDPNIVARPEERLTAKPTWQKLAIVFAGSLFLTVQCAKNLKSGGQYLYEEAGFGKKDRKTGTYAEATEKQMAIELADEKRNHLSHHHEHDEDEEDEEAQQL